MCKQHFKFVAAHLGLIIVYTLYSSGSQPRGRAHLKGHWLNLRVMRREQKTERNTQMYVCKYINLYLGSCEVNDWNEKLTIKYK